MLHQASFTALHQAQATRHCIKPIVSSPGYETLHQALATRHCGLTSHATTGCPSGHRWASACWRRYGPSPWLPAGPLAASPEPPRCRPRPAPACLAGAMPGQGQGLGLRDIRRGTQQSSVGHSTGQRLYYVAMRPLALCHIACWPLQRGARGLSLCCSQPLSLTLTLMSTESIPYPYPSSGLLLYCSECWRRVGVLHWHLLGPIHEQTCARGMYQTCARGLQPTCANEPPVDTLLLTASLLHLSHGPLLVLPRCPGGLEEDSRHRSPS